MFVLSAATSQKSWWVSRGTGFMQSCREIFWEVICSDHHTLLVGATVTVWCSESVSQQERKLSLLEVVLALFVVLLKLWAQESCSEPWKFPLSTVLLWLRQILVVKVVFWQSDSSLGFSEIWDCLCINMYQFCMSGSADTQMFTAALLKLGLIVQQSWTTHSWANALISQKLGVIRRQVSSRELVFTW